MPRGKPNPTLPLNDPNAWQDKFRQYSLRTSFNMQLSRPMLEYLCAVADGVTWNRSLYPGLHTPDNFIATSRSLELRGLIQYAPENERKKRWEESRPDAKFYEWNNFDLTPAGKAVVELLTVSGMFVESDAGLRKKLRKA